MEKSTELKIKNIQQEVFFEIIKQLDKWGEQNHPCLDQTLLNRPDGCTPKRMAEEYEIQTDNRAKQNCDIAFQKNQGTYAHILVEEVSEVVCEFDIHKRRSELIQVAAVAIEWIRKIDRELKKDDLIQNELEEYNLRMQSRFNAKQLVDFGNYLLSEERKAKIENDGSLNRVTDSDLANFIESIKTT